MAEEAKEIIKEKLIRIDLSAKVNEEGMTLQDLLVMFLQACDKHGLYACGVIVKKDDMRVAEIFGMQHDKSENNFLSVKILKETLSRFGSAEVIGTTRISSQTN